MIDTSFAPEFNRCKFSCFGRSVKLKVHRFDTFFPQYQYPANNLAVSTKLPSNEVGKSTPCDRSVPKSSISVEEYIPGAGKMHKTWVSAKEHWSNVIKKGYFNWPVVTSTSTGRMINSSSLDAFVLILMKAVWLSASREEKLALITPFVSNGAISYGTQKHLAYENNKFYHNSDLQ